MKPCRNIFIVLALIMISLIYTPISFADKAMQPSQPEVDKPQDSPSKRAVVNVVYKGTDSIGAKLSTNLKETFNASNLFLLENKDVPKIILTLTTQSEFPSRPNIASIYSIIWTYNQSESHLGYLLSTDLGIISPEDIINLTNKLIEKTDIITVKYGYLF